MTGPDRSWWFITVYGRHNSIIKACKSKLWKSWKVISDISHAIIKVMQIRKVMKSWKVKKDHGSRLAFKMINPQTWEVTMYHGYRVTVMRVFLKVFLRIPIWLDLPASPACLEQGPIWMCKTYVCHSIDQIYWLVTHRVFFACYIDSRS